MSLAVGPYIHQKQVAENHVCHARCSRGSDGLYHLALIDFVRARIWEMNDDPAETSGIELSAEEFFTHPVYAHAVKRVGYRGQGTDDFKLAGNASLMQRPRAVFAA